MGSFTNTLSRTNQIYPRDLIGTAASDASGVSTGLERRMDMFGMLVLTFATGVGGSTLRDIIIGSIPVFWMDNLTYVLMIITSVVLTITFGKQFSEHWSKSLVPPDTIGLGVLAIMGIEKALQFRLSPAIAAIPGIMTGNLGGVIRDTLTNKLPVLLHKEIYATACIAGGTAYFLISGLINHNLAVFITTMAVISMHLLSLEYHWELPKS